MNIVAFLKERGWVVGIGCVPCQGGYKYTNTKYPSFQVTVSQSKTMWTVKENQNPFNRNDFKVIDRGNINTFEQQYNHHFPVTT